MDQDTYNYLSGLGATDDQIQRSYARYQQNPYQAPQAQAGNWFTHALPTAGGIVGGLVTAPLEALDAVSGLGGTALNAAGAAGGSTLGKMLENTLEGQSSSNGLGRAALEGGAGGVLGKVGGSLLGKVFGGGARAAGEGAADLTGTTPETALKLSTAGKLRSGANQMLASQYKTISKPVARAVDLPGTVGKLADMGLINPAEVEQVANGYTGSNGLVNQAVIKAVGNAGRVSTDGLTNIVKDAIENNGLVGSDAKSVTNVINAQMKKLAGGPAGALAPGSNPSDTLSAMQAVEGNIRDLLGKGGTYHLPTTQDVQKARVLGLFRDELQDRLDTAGASANMQNVLTPELAQNLKNLAPGNKTWAAHVDNNIMNSPDLASLRSSQKPFVNISKAINEGELNSPTFGGRITGELPTKTQVLSAVVGSNPVRRAAAGGMNTAANLIDQGSPVATSLPGKVAGDLAAHTTASNGLDSFSPAGLGTSAVAQGLTHKPDFSSPQSALQSDTSATGATGTAPGSATGANATANASDSNPASGFTNDQLQQMLDADLKTGGNHSSTIMEMMKMNQAQDKAGNPPLSAVTKRLYSQVSAADARLNDFQGLMDKVVNQSGPGAILTGLARSAAGAANLDTDAKNFNETRNEMALSISRALSGGNTQGSESMMKRIEGYIPKITDSKESAAAKMQMLHQMLSDTAGSIMSAPDYSGGSTDLSQFTSPQQVSFGQ